MRHVMLDLETWGTRPGCALRSIGAVAFDLDTETAPSALTSQFYLNIDERTCLQRGLIKELSTVEWWEKQPLEARAALLIEPCLLLNAVRSFHEWFRWTAKAQFIWCHGANFDEPIWVAAAHAVGERVPWKFWNVRCTRTIFHLARFDPRSIPREGTHHNALDDARHQARCVIEAHRKLTAAKDSGTSPAATSGERATGDRNPEPAAHG